MSRFGGGWRWVGGMPVGNPKLHSPGFMCSLAEGRVRVVGGWRGAGYGLRKTLPCKPDAGVDAAANENANAHKHTRLYTLSW